ncbi:PilW family protein [Archangium lansingense]|uniref:Prepilin-type N-terminal cleavage/methylation domain-containing protein n=1 Tax=Archangium lansingense TaxID=2995310 RepID=A0ABT4AKC8_9BACT|nr:prepilin-type N-terminal cleavage/methylation domain-containing protein [Archangium lansinium]MCY1082154.1 prepilin-type N-terminal cleavage/methylation domain-containing protein [Archangium lansinium]
MPAPHRPRGFTLIELLVGTAIGALVLTGIGLVFVSQATQYQAHASRRAVQSSVRQAMSFVERHVRNAGYGVDPDRAILAYDSFDAVGNARGVGYPDGITVHARDLYFRRRATEVGTDFLRFDLPLQRTLHKGEILLVLCPGAVRYAYVTVGETAQAKATSVRLDTTPAPLDSPSGPPGSLFRELSTLNEACFHDTEPPVVVRVERTSFYVSSFDDDGDPATAGTTPYLMLHRGVDINEDGNVDTADATPLAVGIEQLQVAYILNTLGDTPPPLVGVDDAVPWGETWHIATPELDRPRLVDAYASPRRLGSHPANIRQVRLTLVARSTRADTQRPGDDVLTPGVLGSEGPPLPSGTTSWRQLENLGTTPAKAFDPRGGGFSRAVLRGSIAPKNLLMRSQFTPVHLGGG